MYATRRAIWLAFLTDLTEESPDGRKWARFVVPRDLGWN